MGYALSAASDAFVICHSSFSLAVSAAVVCSEVLPSFEVRDRMKTVLIMGCVGNLSEIIGGEDCDRYLHVWGVPVA